jgi:hypothetical protein
MESGRSSAHIPQRTCVGCRGRAVQADLLRVVVVGSELVADPARRAPGRGAYVHLDQSCLAQAERRRAWGRALRVTAPLDASAITASAAKMDSSTVVAL